MAITEKLITLSSAAKLLGVSYHFLYDLSKKGVKGFPRPVKQSVRGVSLYRQADFLAFDLNAKPPNYGIDGKLAKLFLTGKLGVRHAN